MTHEVFGKIQHSWLRVSLTTLSTHSPNMDPWALCSSISTTHQLFWAACLRQWSYYRGSCGHPTLMAMGDNTSLHKPLCSKNSSHQLFQVPCSGDNDHNFEEVGEILQLSWSWETMTNLPTPAMDPETLVLHHLYPFDSSSHLQWVKDQVVEEMGQTPNLCLRVTIGADLRTLVIGAYNMVIKKTSALKTYLSS